MLLNNYVYALLLVLLTCAVRCCVLFPGFPKLDVAQPAQLYASRSGPWSASVEAARKRVRSTANLSWILEGTQGEQLVRAREIRAAYAGVIFVGDSQIREVAWAALQLLTPGQVGR